MKKKILLIMTVMLCVLVIGMPVCAVDETVEAGENNLRYVNISDASAVLTLSGNTATCTTILSSKSAKSLSITMKLQKYSGGSWENVATWTTSDSSGTTLTLKKSKSISTGKYRVKSICKCGSESVTKYSSTKTY